MLVKDIMTKRKVSVSPETSLVNAARKMCDSDIGCLLVEKNENLLGIVTDRDIACRGLTSGLDVQEVTVADIMSRDVVWCAEEEHVEDAVRLMEEHKVRRLPVRGGKGELVGMLSISDISLNLPNQLSGEVIAAISHPESGPLTLSSIR